MRRRLGAVLVLLIVAAGCAGAGGPAPTPAPATATLPAGVDVVVRKVVDGDTLDVSGGERVRLIGIDTPESVAPDRPVGCFGKEASRFTASLVPPGTPVRLVGDVEQRDRFGRLLAYVYRQADGLFVNAELLRQGYAQLLTIPPNIAHTDEFTAIARRAREGAQGLWAACTLLPDGRVAPASSGPVPGAG
ncbi:MAG TPA: thermonuclease family protein [Acidimicrobiales bacterium]|nr:thermonuclease family protein [Acidimicrobiales bacterium]